MTPTETRPAIAAGTYQLDPRRTTVAFAIREMFGMMTIRGTFAVRHGTVTVDADPARSSVTVELDPASFASGNTWRDKDIRSARWLDVASHPTMSFASTRLDPATRTLEGMLTVHGVTAPVTLLLTDAAAMAGGCRFTATTSIDRREFGVSKSVGFISHNLDVTIQVFATR